MNLMGQLKVALLNARTEQDIIARGILSTVVGEVDTLRFAKGQKAEVSDQQITKVMQKVIAGNKETIDHAKKREAPVMVSQLERENAILESLLPKMWGKGEVEKTIMEDAATLQQIRDAGNDGQAIGMAMKFLKSQKAPVNGGDVSEVVKVLRETPPSE